MINATNVANAAMHCKRFNKIYCDFEIDFNRFSIALAYLELTANQVGNQLILLLRERHIPLELKTAFNFTELTCIWLHPISNFQEFFPIAMEAFLAHFCAAGFSSNLHKCTRKSFSVFRKKQNEKNKAKR
jgi:hypothetical protein